MARNENKTLTVQRDGVSTLDANLLGVEQIVAHWGLRAVLLTKGDSLETGVEAGGVSKLLELHAVDTRGVALDGGGGGIGQAGENECGEDGGQHDGTLRWCENRLLFIWTTRPVTSGHVDVI